MKLTESRLRQIINQEARRMLSETYSQSRPSPVFTGFWFPPDVILLAVRWYLRWGCSYRDLEGPIRRCSGGSD